MSHLGTAFRPGWSSGASEISAFADHFFRSIWCKSRCDKRRPFPACCDSAESISGRGTDILARKKLIDFALEKKSLPKPCCPSCRVLVRLVMSIRLNGVRGCLVWGEAARGVALRFSKLCRRNAATSDLQVMNCKHLGCCAAQWMSLVFCREGERRRQVTA